MMGLEWPWYYLISGGSSFLLLLLYIHSKVAASVPRVYSKPGKLRKLLVETKSLRSSYSQPLWCISGTFHTSVRQLLKNSHSLPFEREILKFEDGGQAALDWLSPSTQESPTSPVVIVLPGLTGSTFESYVTHLLKEVQKYTSYRAVVFNNRGNGGLPLLTPQTYSAAYTKDLEKVVGRVKQRYPHAPCIAVGFSLGGMILFNYTAGKAKAECGIEAAMCVSCPWDPVEASVALEQFWPRIIFNKRLAKNLCSMVNRNRSIMLKYVKDFDWVLQSNLIREFDERLVAPMFGYKDVWEYYRDASFVHKLDTIHIPVLLLNAEDDVFAPIKSIPFEEVEASDNVISVVTGQGGHIAFMKSMSPDDSGLIEELFLDYAQIILHEL